MNINVGAILQVSRLLHQWYSSTLFLQARRLRVPFQLLPLINATPNLTNQSNSSVNGTDLKGLVLILFV